MKSQHKKCNWQAVTTKNLPCVDPDWVTFGREKSHAFGKKWPLDWSHGANFDTCPNCFVLKNKNQKTQFTTQYPYSWPIASTTNRRLLTSVDRRAPSSCSQICDVPTTPNLPSCFLVDSFFSSMFHDLFSYFYSEKIGDNFQLMVHLISVFQLYWFWILTFICVFSWQMPRGNNPMHMWFWVYVLGFQHHQFVSWLSEQDGSAAREATHDEHDSG